jgi:hypothetical protein
MSQPNAPIQSERMNASGVGMTAGALGDAPLQCWVVNVRIAKALGP